MTFDSHSLERLKELGRKLPKEISKPQSNELKNLKTTLETITYFTQIKINYLKYNNKKIFNQYFF